MISRETAECLKVGGWDQRTAVVWKGVGAEYSNSWSVPTGFGATAYPSLEQLLEDFRERGYALRLALDSLTNEWEFRWWLKELKSITGTDPVELVAQAWLQEFGAKEAT